MIKPIQSSEKANPSPVSQDRSRETIGELSRGRLKKKSASEKGRCLNPSFSEKRKRGTVVGSTRISLPIEWGERTS